MDGSMTNRCDAFKSIVLQVSLDLAWSPTFTPPQFQNEVHS